LSSNFYFNALTRFVASFSQTLSYLTCFAMLTTVHYFLSMNLCIHAPYITPWTTFPVDCLLPNCSGNGVCSLGQCVCYKGYKGTDCSIQDKINITHLCAKDCSGHGLYNPDSGSCECESLFTGSDCETGNCSNLHRMWCIWNTSVCYLRFEELLPVMPSECQIC